jgi:hypothetical protein
MRVRNFDPSTPKPPFGKELQQVAHQNKRERNEQQKNERRESGEDNNVLIISGTQESQLEGSLRNQNDQQEKYGNGEQNNDLLAVRRFLRRD